MENTLNDIELEMDFTARMTSETEMDFSEHKSLRLECMELDFSMAVPGTSVQPVKATEVVITATLQLSQMSIARWPTTILLEGSLHV